MFYKGTLKPEEKQGASRGAAQISSRASSRATSPVRLTTESVEYKTEPRRKKIPVIRLKRADSGHFEKDDPEPGPSWRE